MRSIAHDLGQAMGCGAHLQELRRMASGEFELDQARTIAQLAALAADERLIDALVPASKMLPGFPVGVRGRSHGARRSATAATFRPRRSGRSPASQYVKAVTRPGDLVAIGEAVLPNLYHPVVVL